MRVKIQGWAQGVWFRESCKQKAEELGLSGWVQNENVGTVLTEVEGEEKILNKFIKWCEEGPEMARVEKVEIEELEENKI